MPESKAEKLGIAIVLIMLAVVLLFVGLGVWGFIELIQWITSK